VNTICISSLHQVFITYWKKPPLCLHRSSCFTAARNNEHLNTQGRWHQQPRKDPVKRLRTAWLILWVSHEVNCYKRSFKKSGKYSYAKHFIMTSLYTWHMGGWWYISHLHIGTIDIQAFVPLWKKWVLSVSIQEVTPCFTLVCVTNSLLAIWFLKRCKSVGMRSD